MKIIDYIKNLFKHKEINTNGELVRPADLIKIPKRNEFNNDILVDYYKDEYYNILSTMKDYDPLILEADEINNNIIMTSKLLFNIAIKEEYKNEKSVEDRINYLINSEKLDLYKEDINKIQNEVIGRLIALSEIRKEVFLSKKKKNIIDNIIDRLIISLNILYAEEVSIINNIERYKNESKYSNEPSKEEKEKEYEIINEKIKHLEWLQEILDSDSQINIRTDINYILKDIALIEKELEEYTFIHKGEITEESKNNEIEEIIAIPFDIEHKEELLKRIKEIEIKYRTFYEYKEYQEYGDIIIDESDLTNIYNLKFGALTISQDGMAESFINSAIDEEIDKAEIAYYQNIIFSMVQDIIMGRNEVFNEIFSKDYTNAILLVKKIFIDEDANVLTDFGRLNLLLAFNTKDGFYNLFTNFKAQHFIDDSVLFKWDEKLPLETICFVLRTCHKPIVIKTDRNIYTYIFNSYLFDLILDLYSIYRKFYKPIEEYKYYLPEGLIAINENNISDIDELSLNDEALVNEIQQNSKEEVTYFPRSLSIVGYKRKAIYFPKSLKVIGNTSKLFEDFPLTDIILNEGLEKILPKAFEMQKFSKINIPSTINTLSMTSFAESFSRGTIKTVTFNINKNNAPILNENIMNELFNGMPFHIFLELPFSNIIIHIEELDKDIDINLSDLDLSFDNLEQKNGRTNIKKLIKYFEELLDDERKTFSKMQPVIEEVDDRVEIRTDYKGLLTDLEILNKKFKEFAENNKDYAHYLASEIEDAYCFRNIEGNNYYEAMCNIFTYYGILDKSILENFYRLLFKNMIDSKRPFINDTLTKIELNIYSECIKSIINTSYEYPITSSNGQNVMPDEDAKEIQKLIIKILKGNKKEIAVKEILTNYFKLNLLFSYAKPKMLIDFFEQFTCSALKKELPHSQIEFSNNLPLGTFCLINYYLGESLSQSLILEQNNTTIPLYYDVYKLYHLIYKYYHSAKQLSLISKDKYVNSIANNPLYYFIPDGIIRIDISNGSNKTEVSDKIIDGIRNDAKDKYVFLPNSLKSFALDTISKVNTSVKEIYLNEGLETLYLITYLIQNFETLTIPSTVSRIEIFDYFLSIYNNENKGNFRNIIFNNFNLDNIEIIHTILKSVITRNDYRASNNLITFTFHYDNLDEDIIVKLDFDKYKHLREKGLDLTIKEWFINDTILEIKEKIVEKKGKSKILK